MLSSSLIMVSYSSSGIMEGLLGTRHLGDHRSQADMTAARSNNIWLVVKATGHDFISRSSGLFSLSIWKRHMKSIQPVENFQPQKCEHATYGPAVKLGAGTQLGDAYEALGPLNRTIVGATVSLGGFLTGGGHSLLSPRYGMGADQVLEMEVVTRILLDTRVTGKVGSTREEEGSWYGFKGAKRQHIQAYTTQSCPDRAGGTSRIHRSLHTAQTSSYLLCCLLMLW